jgi:tRNA nucleotidyltransferase (CCA-adding enzyme)
MTTVMVLVAPSFVDDVLWPQFQELDRELSAHLQTVTDRIIREAVHGEGGGVEEEEAEGRIVGGPASEAGRGGEA